MGLIDRFEAAYVEVSSSRATLRDLLELAGGAVLFVLVAAGLAYSLLGQTAALVVAGALGVVFAVTVVSQAYWAVAGREEYEE